ncbi:MAG: hypothetical protein JWO38_4189 [Gemmataceae bacterium]|nr:hypothetical protein [Gemmataceae bacterium]
MNPSDRPCPDYDVAPVSRRQFLRASAAAAVSVGTLPLFATPKAVAAPKPESPAETLVKRLHDSLTDDQKKKICFPWDHTETGTNNRGLLRTHVSNNWQVTPYRISGERSIYTKDQQAIVQDIFKSLTNPEWHDRFMKQLKDDSGGKPWGAEQSVAIFGTPGTDKFELVLTGRHQTLRADGNTEGHVAFGGPIFYGHAGLAPAGSLTEKPDHPENVFWPQALAANGVYKMLDGKQQKAALVPKSPRESAIGFRGTKVGEAPGLPVGEISKDQKAELQKVLAKLIEPFRVEDRDEAAACLTAQGGLDACRLSFYADEDMGDDGVWDNWRVEGPAFVWYFRGSPHVHVWVHVADSPDVKANARG